MQLLRATGHRRMPWKNGGGETFEIAIFPPGATLDTLDWRLSMAVVACDGPFSCFPGIDRTLAILDGAGMALQLGEGPRHLLTRESAPLPFAADLIADARLVAGTTTDFNVMTRRSRLHHTVRRLQVDARLHLASDAATAALLCSDGEIHCSAPGRAPALLQARDCLLLHTPADGVQLQVDTPARALWVELFPA